MAFLLLLVKTVGRETPKPPGRLEQMDNGAKIISGRDIDVGSPPDLLQSVAEINQSGGIENTGSDHWGESPRVQPTVLRSGMESHAALRIFREVPTTLFLYLANQSTPNSSLLFKVSSPITVLSATCGAFTSISSRIFSTLTTTSRLPRTMMVFARWSAMILALPTVTALGVVSTAVVDNSSETFSVLSLAVLERPPVYGLVDSV